jgi:predicted esterase
MTTDFIHRFVPGDGDSSRPLLLLLHGTGGTENDLLPLGMALVPGAPLLSPRGKVLERGSPRFFRRLAEGVFDLEDMRVRTLELAAFVRSAVGEYGLDGRRIFALGYSNGANIATSTMFRDPALLSGAVLLRGMVPFEPETTPDLSHAQVLISAGRRDPIVPASQLRRLAALYTAARAGVTVREYEAGHELAPQEPADVHDWLTRVVASERSATPGLTRGS